MTSDRLQDSLSPKQLEFAFQRWLREAYPAAQASHSVKVFTAETIPADVPGERSLLQLARQCLLLSRTHVAEKAGVSRSTIQKMEASELNGSISLKNLHRIAGAMDCEIVLGIRHKSHLSFSHWIWTQILEKSLHHHWVRSRPTHAKGAALAAVARDFSRNPHFRKTKGWSRNQK